MNFKIIMILVILATFQILRTNARKRIKRQFNLMTHDKRMKPDFILLPNEKLDHSESAKDIPKPFDESFTTAAPDNTNNILNDSEKKCNASRPLVEVLRTAKYDSIESRKSAGPKADMKSRDLNKNEEKSKTMPDKHCNIIENVEERLNHHKNKYLPHSTGVFEAKIVMPSHQIKPALHDLGSFGSMNLNNMIMYKVRMDSSPSSLFYPKLLLTQNSPSFLEDETLNEPSWDYFFNSLGTPRGHNLYRQTFKQSNSPIIDSNWQTHAIFNEPSAASVKEPTQLASLMQNALDALLANNEDIDGDKSTQQIEFRCPIHQAKKSAQIEGDRPDVIQVCSCRLIKKAKEDDLKKLK